MRHGSVHADDQIECLNEFGCGSEIGQFRRMIV